MSIESIIDGPLKIKSYARGEMIYNQGATAQFYYEIKNGHVRVINMNDDGKEFVQGLYKAGDCIGLPSLICEQPYPAAAFAHSKCEICLLSGEQFFKLLKQNPAFHLRMTRMLSERLLYKAMMLEEVAIEEGEHRLLALIHYLMKQNGDSGGTLNITKQQLADMSGLRVETVIRILKKVEERGLINTHRGNIICNFYDNIF